MHKPPKRSKRYDTDQNDAVVVHRRHGGRQGVREAKQDVEKDYEEACKAIDHISSFAHPECSRWDIASSSEHVGYETHSVGRGGENHERACKITESRFAAKSNGAEGVRQETGKERGRDGTAEAFVDKSEESGERGSVIACQSPECATNLYRT